MPERSKWKVPKVKKIKHLYNLAIIRYINMISLSFERIPILESSRKRGLPPNLCTNKGKP